MCVKLLGLMADSDICCSSTLGWRCNGRAGSTWSLCLWCVWRTVRSTREFVFPSSWLTEIGLYPTLSCKISRVVLGCPSAFPKSLEVCKMRQGKVLLWRAIAEDIFHPSHFVSWKFASLFWFSFPSPSIIWSATAHTESSMLKKNSRRKLTGC